MTEKIKETHDKGTSTTTTLTETKTDKPEFVPAQAAGAPGPFYETPPAETLEERLIAALRHLLKGGTLDAPTIYKLMEFVEPGSAELPIPAEKVVRGFVDPAIKAEHEKKETARKEALKEPPAPTIPRKPAHTDK